MTRLAVVCAWCKQPKTERDRKLLEEGALVTHGICEECSEKLEREIENGNQVGG